MTDISFLKAVVKRRRDEKQQRAHLSRNKNCASHLGGIKKKEALRGLTKPATSNKESISCCVGLIEGTGRGPLPGQGCGEGGE